MGQRATLDECDQGTAIITFWVLHIIKAIEKYYMELFDYSVECCVYSLHVSVLKPLKIQKDGGSN